MPIAPEPPQSVVDQDAPPARLPSTLGATKPQRSNYAGNHALVSNPILSKDEHLMDTHFLHVQLDQTGENAFSVSSATVKLQIYLAPLLGDKTWSEYFLNHVSNAKNGIRTKVVGVIFVLCTCGPALFCRPIFVSQLNFFCIKSFPYRPDWEAALKASVDNDA